MQKLTCLTITSMFFITGCAGGIYSNNNEMIAKNVAQIHMGHVSTAWNDTPDGKGLLPTAMAEAEIAAFHAGLAAKKPDDLEWMKVHVRHVINALDPASEAKGPGLGYGVVKASAGTAKHMGFAAASEDASQNIKLHSEHVATSAQNTVNRAKEILELSEKVLAAGNASTAAPLVKNISGLASHLANGFDANSDGNITWQKNEGGLNAANKHIKLMADGEGMGSG